MNKQIFNIAFRGVFRNWRQSLTVVIACCSGYLALVLFQGYMDDVENMYVQTNIQREMMGHVIIEQINKSGEIEPMSVNNQQNLISFSGENNLAAVVRFLRFSGQVTNGKSTVTFLGIAHDIEQGLEMRKPDWTWNALAGRPLENEMDAKVLIGKSLGQLMGCEAREKLVFTQGLKGFPPSERAMSCPTVSLQVNVSTDHGQANSMDLPISGITDAIYKEVDERFLAVPLNTGLKLMDTDKVSYMSVRAHQDSEAIDLLKKLESVAQQKQWNLKIQRWQTHEMGDLYVRTMDLLGVFRNFVVITILFISGLSVLNTFIRNISERTREIGTLRSIGFRRSQIRRIFAYESILLSILGSGAGVILAFVFQQVVNALSVTYKPGVFSAPVPFRVALSAPLILQTLVVLCVIIIVAAKIALQRSLNMKVSDNLTST